MDLRTRGQIVRRVGLSCTLACALFSVPGLAQQPESNGASQVQKESVSSQASSNNTKPEAKALGVLPVLGKGTTNTIPVWTGTYTIGNSILSQSGGTLTVSGAVSARSFVGDGSALTNVNANLLSGLSSSAFAQQGTSNTFSGDQSITGNLNVSGYFNNALSLQGNLTDASGQQGANVLGGFTGVPGLPANSIAPGVIGATVGGGGGVFDPSSIPGSASKRKMHLSPFHPPSDFHKSKVAAVGGLVSGANIVAAGGNWSTIGGGLSNSVGGFGATVGGGFANNGIGDNSFVGGGFENNGTGSNSVAVGGESNSATGIDSMVLGGSGNMANGDLSLAAGSCAMANFDGSFVWSGSNAIGACVPVNSTQDTAPSQFVAEAYGGFYLYTSTFGASGSGAVLPAGSGSWSAMSDRSSKTNFVGVDTSALLEKIVALPLSSWSYRTQSDSIRHLGPMAQDFRAAFGLGEDDKHISNIDSEGVSLAGIQALYKLNQEKDRKIAELSHALENLAQRLAAIEQVQKPKCMLESRLN